jgi:hypothetical protein
MSEEQRKDEETEVEGHRFPPSYGSNDEPEDEVEGHRFPPSYGSNDEPEDEVEGHVHRRG